LKTTWILLLTFGFLIFKMIKIESCFKKNRDRSKFCTCLNQAPYSFSKPTIYSSFSTVYNSQQFFRSHTSTNTHTQTHPKGPHHWDWATKGQAWWLAGRV